MTVLWPVGTRFRHHAGSEWIVTEIVGGEHDDHRVRCVVGTARPGYIGGEQVGSERVLHAEYIFRSMAVVWDET